MKSNDSSLSFSLLFTSSFSELATATAILETFLQAAPAIRPNLFGQFDGTEPFVNAQTAASAFATADQRVASRSIVLIANRYCEYQAYWSNTVPPTFSFITGTLNAPKSSDGDLLKSFLALVRTLATRVPLAYGEVRHAACPSRHVPFDLRRRLPDIPAVSIYGSPYIELFGRERIEHAPVHRVEAIAPDTYWLQATESPAEVVPAERQALIRQALGEESFMVGTRWKYSNGIHPQFNFAQVGDRTVWPTQR